MATVILKCTCTHRYQDREHGYQNRVMNTTKENDKVRCTVCGETKNHFHGKGE